MKRAALRCLGNSVTWYLLAAATTISAGPTDTTAANPPATDAADTGGDGTGVAVEDGGSGTGTGSRMVVDMMALPSPKLAQKNLTRKLPSPKPAQENMTCKPPCAYVMAPVKMRSFGHEHLYRMRGFCRVSDGRLAAGGK